ncbi:carboxymuconolactone decarboxylase family protein [Trinickia caryophylli]|uniref:Uncharacterized peroxidase-related enzyme n=1 Tax=Trinickia caryophylli TaxID=28094 RepID=A0A1X7D275_TRICW|nr:carboxymuconolactone decarboxylase family protein [Trinickia caryophylli]PMS12850.1 alkylhydroperoxidase [Trinickia caryophylli]TRX15217.1 carboxymuconolactone decarboxylase family protein [Trinickia caryophylli]WQE15087.1 carboxymuconolactone decarboxylase family protein [Trinickia caryophylli]SMF07444.1 uncharacterized peroxidase-related enzyme [Trinickia caryophylli]GLU31178.1 alkyl hydroperoxide reductase AhpD [Trinickia caryophylli]
MSRLRTIKPEDATGPLAEVFSAIRKAVGKVPNTYAVIGTQSHDALGAALAFDAAVGRGTLAKADIEIVKLVVSEFSGCDYCIAVHTFVGKANGLAGEAMKAARAGASTGDAKRDALVAYVRALVGTRGTVPAETVEAVRRAGYTDRQLIEINLAIASITFTNLVNRVNDTPLDFPKVD